MKSKIVFFGSSKFVIPILEILQKNFDLSLVLTTEKNSADAVPKYCTKNKIPYLSVSNLSDSAINHELLTINSPIAILADFGLIIPKEILNIFPKGIINFHPSLLPKYRGPTPVQTAILNGEKITGVSIIKLDSQVDHGPILFRKEEKILNNDTSESLYERLFKKSADFLPDVLKKYLNGNIIPTEQNHNKATFTKPLTREDGFINLSAMNHELLTIELAKMIRAYFPWPGTWTKLRIANRELRIKFLPDKKIQVEGKKPVDIETFKRGYPETKELLERLFG